MIWLTLALAGDPCRSLPVQKDDDPVQGGASWEITDQGYKLAEHDGTPYLTVYVNEPGPPLDGSVPGLPYRLDLTDGTQLELFPTEGTGVVRAMTSVVQGVAYTTGLTYGLRAPLSVEGLHALAGARPQELRYTVAEARRVALSRLIAARMQRAAACLANRRAEAEKAGV